MKKIISAILLVCLCVVLCACGAKDGNIEEIAGGNVELTSETVESTSVSTIPTDPPERSLRRESYAKLVEHLSKHGSTEISDEIDINNPYEREIISYFDKATRTAGEYIFDTFISVPYDGEEITFTLTVYNSPIYIRIDRYDYIVTITYMPIDGNYDVIWVKERVLGRSRIEKAKGEIIGLKANQYNENMIYPDIENFHGVVDDKTTIRQDMIDHINVAMNDMCLMIGNYGIDTADLGFTSFTPHENLEIKPLREHLERFCTNVVNKYPDYVYSARYNGTQVSVVIKPDSLIAQADDVNTRKIREEFFRDCANILWEENIVWEYQNHKDHVELLFLEYDDRDAYKHGKIIGFFNIE